MGRLVPYIVTFSIVVVVSVILASMQPPDPLTASTWQWTATTTRGDAAPSDVPDPAKYTIRFGTDGTIQATADCNTASGTYRVIPGGRSGPNPGLVISPGATTQVACPAGSLSDTFIADLGAAASYVIKDGQLRVGLADGGAMTFRPG
jgi:heat shock protein HslJ